MKMISCGLEEGVGYNTPKLQTVLLLVVVQSLVQLLQPHGLQPASLLCPWDSSGKNIGVGCHSVFQGISLTQGLNPGLPHCRQILYHLNHQESPIKPWDSPGKNTGIESHFLVSGIFLPSDRILVSYIASRFFTTVQPREA